MNTTERLKDGTILMSVKVDGRLTKRPCEYVSSASRLSFQNRPEHLKLVPIIYDSEELIEFVAGGFEIISKGI